MPHPRRLVACFLLAVSLSAVSLAPALVAQRGGQSRAELVLHAYTLKHQPASDAIALVHPLLSPRGTVELQPGGNTLVLRDIPAALGRILPVLRDFDHPPRPLDLEIYVVRASRVAMSPPVSHSDLPPELTQRLRDLLPYEIYEKVAQAQLATLEGQSVAYDLGQDYRVSFRVGTMLGDRRVKLSEFLIRRTRGKAKPLLYTNLNLWLERTMSLGLAKSEDSREVLMVVLTLKGGERRPEREP